MQIAADNSVIFGASSATSMFDTLPNQSELPFFFEASHWYFVVHAVDYVNEQ